MTLRFENAKDWLFPLGSPYDLEKNLGAAYNRSMALLPEGAWGIFIDADAAWTTPVWYRQIAEAIIAQPEAGLFTAVASRIGPRWQRAGDRESHDMNAHVRCGVDRLRIRTLLDVTDTKGLGGVVIVTSKEAWRSVGGFVDGFRCVDHVYHFAQRAAGRRVFVIEGLFVYHRRGTSGDPKLASTTPVAANCPCRGPEQQPSVRVTIPSSAA